jgi:heme-degrading monooxygenase HmoA
MAAKCVEIVRIRPKAGEEEELLAARPQMLADLSERHPGLQRTTLVRADDGILVDVLEWESRDQAQAALADGENIPGFGAWMAHIDEITSFDMTDVIGD